jgi:putative transposase
VPWKENSSLQSRFQFVEDVHGGKGSLAEICRRYGIARSTGYLWLKRYHASGFSGLQPRRSGRPVGATGKRRARWQESLLALRRRHPTWGPKKLRILLQREKRSGKLPSERTIARLLLEGGLVGRRQQRQKAGPELAAVVTSARSCNAVWTLDFKGHFFTGDGRKCLPLTIRDLFSRYLLCTEHLDHPSEAAVRKVMTRYFRRHGLPRVIRVDNGSPFAGVGPLQLSGLSVWWLRLGIRVEFTRRGKPQDNGAHEQMHRVMKQHTARPPSASLAQQKRRLEQFRQHYNEERPHEALDQRTPASVYRASRIAYGEPGKLSYGKPWVVRIVSTKGYIKWKGRIRLVGRAFAHQCVGLKAPRTRTPAERSSIVKVQLGNLLIGELHDADLAGMRGARWRRRKATV